MTIGPLRARAREALFMTSWKAGAVGIVLMVLSTSIAHAVTFNFGGYGGLADSYDFSSSGINLTVTAGRFKSDGTIIDEGRVGQYAWGLGATTRWHDSHQVDGYKGNDILIFSFDQKVTLEKVAFSYVDGNDRFRFFHDTDHDGELTDFGTSIDIPYGNVYVFNSVWDGKLFGIGAKGKYDNFKIEGFHVTPIPLPAALPLFAGALGLLGLFGWRRKRAAAR